MSSFASLATLAHRLQRKKRNLARKPVESTAHLGSDRCEVQPLPCALSDNIPQEIFEHFIDYLHDDTLALSICSIVCQAWLPAARYHLFGSLLVRPVRLNLGWSLDVNCSVALRGEQYILYGNKKGVYWSEPERKLAPVRVLSLPDVSQIDVLEDHNLLICLSAHRVTTIPLNMLSLTSRKDITSCTIVSSHVSLFKIGTQSNRKFVCIVKAGSNSVFKMMEPNFRPSRGSSELRQYKEFYIPERVTSVHFLKRMIVAGTSNHGFEVIDIETLHTATLADPPGSPVTLPFLNRKPLKCLSIYCADREFLLCYSKCAVYVDRSGQLSRGYRLLWVSPIEATVYREPYILAFSPLHLEVWDSRNGRLLQTVRGSYRLLSPFTDSEPFMVQSDDGRVLGLQFS